MNKLQRIELLRNRSEKIYTNGKLLDYKLYGDRKRRYILPPPVYENEALNPVQSFLYKRALKGLDVYTKRELRELELSEKHKVIKMYSRTQKELNIWKHKLTIKASNDLLKLFPNSSLAKAIINDNYLDVQTKNSFSFRDLGVRKEDIINQLCQVGILPDNFHQINAK